MKSSFRTALLVSCAAFVVSFPAYARNFDIPQGELEQALDAYMAQTGLDIVVSTAQVRGIRSAGAKGDLADNVALAHILSGTGFVVSQHPGGAIAVVRDQQKKSMANEPLIRLAETVESAHAAAGVETVVVTSSKIKGDIQTVPIAITALSQEQLTSRQIAGGPDLVKEVPNLTFTKTNFTGYSIQIRGIGTQAISVTTDPAVAVAFNDTPFLRNHFFEQEFYDVNQVEVLRGPQGTLYGRNATAGVVNVISAKPTDQFEAMLSADWGNYHNRRYEGMINIPVMDDRFDVRLAGEWTKRDGYSTNEYNNTSIDGRDLWSTRLTIGFKPTPKLQTWFIWEHFQEDDDRLRSGKQLCTTDYEPTSVGGQDVPNGGELLISIGAYLSQGCKMGSLYAPTAYGVPDGYSLPYYTVAAFGGFITTTNPYLSDKQTPDLRVINTQIAPTYKAKNDLFELNADYQVFPDVTFSSATGFNHDFLWSTEDYNRFASSPGMFPQTVNDYISNGVFCDPQLGCSDKILAEDLSEEHSWQFSQEFRFASNFKGPFNFSIGGNYLHYETDENYYVFINTLTAFAWSEGGSGNNAGLTRPPWMAGVSDNSQCLVMYGGYRYHPPAAGGGSPEANACVYIDPNPIGHLNNNGHNYFLSRNPYTLNSYAGFGEAYFDIDPELKLTTGLRWTVDEKHFVNIPSELVDDGWGYATNDSVDQKWGALTGRAALNWTPKLPFTQQTLVYGSIAHGYKAGGANPPGPVLPQFAQNDSNPIHPLIFKPEYVNAFELGTKNTLLDGGLTLNGDVFYYNYKAYQISEIVDRTAINRNYDSHVKGAEIEATWEPLPGLRFNATGGYEDARVAKGQSEIDLMDRTDRANHPDWMIVRPFPTQASNCILPVDVVAAMVYETNNYPGGPGSMGSNESDSNPVIMCNHAYVNDLDPVTQLPYTAYPTVTADLSGGQGAILPGYAGFNPETAPNGGEGFKKDLSNHLLPNAPHFTTSLAADYTLPVSEDWAATVHSDFYWQSQSFARVFNDRPYDKIRGYSNVNLALIVTGASGWQVMGYLKNVFDTTAITGDFLNSDDSDLTTNVFLTDPRLFGIRVTKNW